MRPIGRWAHLMSSYVSVAPRTGVDRYNKPTYGTPVQYKAHLTMAEKYALNQQGDTVLINVTATLMTNDAIAPTARVTLSTGDIGSTESVMINPILSNVKRAFDQTGPNFTELMLTYG